MLKSSALLLRCWWRKKKDLIGSFLYNLLLSWWSNTIYEFHPNSSQHFGSHSICQPISDTWHVTLKRQDAPLHFHLPLLPFQPPTSKDERLNEHQVSGPHGPLTNPEHRAGLVSPFCCKENGTIHRFLAKLFQGLELFHRITERSDQLTDFKTWSRTGTNSREELDRVFRACHLCLARRWWLWYTLALFFAYVCIE